MPTERVVVDGLWRCLRPSVDVASLSRPFAIPRRRAALACHNGASTFAQRSCQHSLHDSTDLSRKHSLAPRDKSRGTDRTRTEYLKRVARRSPWIPKILFEDSQHADEQLNAVPTQTIYEALQELQHVEGAYISITSLVDYLVRVRAEKPNALLYECLIRANVDHLRGSAQVAGNLLKEMVRQNIQTTPRVYQALLEVTAVHPDYVLRSSVLREMKSRWYSPSLEGMASIIVGLLRDGQHEHALEKLEALYKSPDTVPPWLYNIFLYVFGEMGYHNETFSILEHQLKIYGPNQSTHAWLFLLHVFSRDGFYQGVTYIWDRMVVPGSLQPPDGVALDVLNTASKHGDVTTATSVIQTLAERGRKLDMHHYEALVDAHVLNEDLEKGFLILCIMAKAGLVPDLSSTRSIYRLLRESTTATEEAVTILHQLRQQFEVPIAAFNVVLEAKQIHDGFEAAFTFYRDVRRICVSGPDLTTYKIL